MLMAKYYIFRCKCLKTIGIPNFVFRKRLGKEHIYRNTPGVEGRPDYVFFREGCQGDPTTYFSLWYPYFPLFSDNNV